MSLQTTTALGSPPSVTLSSTLASNVSPTPPASTSPLDVHYFDVLHSIFLSHIRRSNSEGVLALLMLPAISCNPLFWQTCTYREGLVAALLTYVIQHTGQTTVRLPMETERSLGNDAGQGSPHTGVGKGKTCPLKMHDLYRLLYRCVFPAKKDALLDESASLPSVISPRQPENKEEREDNFGAFAVSTCAMLLSLPACKLEASRFRTRSCGEYQNNGTLQDDRDLKLLLRSVLRNVETIIKSARKPTTTYNEVADESQTALTPSRKRSREDQEKNSDREKEKDCETEVPSHASSKGDLSIDLAALVAVLQEHYSTFLYVNPLSGQDQGESQTNVIRGVNASAPKSTSAVSAAAAADDSNSTSRSAGAPPTAIAEAKCASMKRNSFPNNDRNREVVESVGSEVDTAGEDGDVDAVMMLQRLPAISAVRWTVPVTVTATPAAEERNNTDKSEYRKTCCLSQTISSSGEQHRNALSSASTRNKSQPASNGGSNSKSSIHSTTAYQDAEQARVSAAIRAFDAFTAALEEQRSLPQVGNGNLATTNNRNKNAGIGFTPAQRHRDGPSTPTVPPSRSGVSATLTLQSNSELPAQPTQSNRLRFSSTTVSMQTSAAAAPTTSPFDNVLPLALSFEKQNKSSTRNNDSRTVKRRHKFSAREDAAIMHGVAQFGQGPGKFQYIFHAYRNVWREGRTPIHLYDHWRGVLRRCAVAAACDEALLMNAEEQEGGEIEGSHTGSAAAGRHELLCVRAPPARAVEDVESDIEDSPQEDA